MRRSALAAARRHRYARSRAYTNQETLEIIRSNVTSEVTPRSTRLNPSQLSLDHPIAHIADQMGIDKFGSPTTSDQAVMPFPGVATALAVSSNAAFCSVVRNVPPTEKAEDSARRVSMKVSDSRSFIYKSSLETDVLV